MIMTICLMSQNNFCFDSIQIKEIRRLVDNGIIYKSLCDSLLVTDTIQKRTINNLYMQLDNEKEQNFNNQTIITYYKSNEKLYKKEIKKQKLQKYFSLGIAVFVVLIAGL